MASKKSELTRRSFFGVSVSAGVGAAGIVAVGCNDGGGKKDKDENDELGRGANPDQDTSEIRWGFLIDIRRCRGCRACSIACKTENDVRLGVFRNGVKSREEGTYPNTKRHFVPWLCNHCKTPACLDRCPVEPVKASVTFPNGTTTEYWARATYQRPDGLVYTDQERCIGCGLCVEDCPYGARFLDRVKPAGKDPAEYGLTIESPKAVSKCTLCIHRLEKGLVTSCVNTCPTGARMVGNINDPNSEISKAIAAAGSDIVGLLPDEQTEPHVFYIGLDAATYNSGIEARTEAGFQLMVPEIPELAEEV